jgi:glutamate/tyrosine decarboxylase-like PLP-dependent enzyme
MAIWKKRSKEEIRKRVFDALNKNVDYDKIHPLGIPGSHLDSKVFYQDAPFLADAPFLSTLIHNPNHIGCHTLGKSESFFEGTQAIERELIHVCAENIINASEDACDGYVASGGTEANMQAIWIYRNYFMRKHGAKPDEICIICSADFHYSMSKAADVLGIRMIAVPVDDDTRTLLQPDLRAAVESEKANGVTCFIAVANMMTTMFGSVDNPMDYADALQAAGVQFKLHVDGAYGGFIYPFTHPDNHLDFRNEVVTSVTLDAHKMVQAPYGTGIFLIRKGWMQYANTKDASYVEGEDYTLIGSRSGANAVAVWMILMTYGRYGWEEKMSILMKRTDWLVAQFDEMGIAYYRNPYANIVTFRAGFATPAIAKRYGLVPDDHHAPAWYKVVVMEHVTIERLMPLVEDLKKLRTEEQS